VDAVDAVEDGILLIVGQNLCDTIVVRWGTLHRIVGQQEEMRIEQLLLGNKRTTTSNSLASTVKNYVILLEDRNLESEISLMEQILNGAWCAESGVITSVQDIR